VGAESAAHAARLRAALKDAQKLLTPLRGRAGPAKKLRSRACRLRQADNPFGDQIDSRVPHYTDIPASLVETNKQVFDRSTQTPRTVRQGTCVGELGRRGQRISAAGTSCRRPSWRHTTNLDTYLARAPGESRCESDAAGHGHEPL
jgi:hypothetical protein